MRHINEPRHTNFIIQTLRLVVKFKPSCSATETNSSLESLDLAGIDSKQQRRLSECMSMDADINTNRHKGINVRLPCGIHLHLLQ